VGIVMLHIMSNQMYQLLMLLFLGISNDFTATKLVAEGTMEVEVTSFNGKMAICSDEEGCVLITREQAIKFFNL